MGGRSDFEGAVGPHLVAVQRVALRLAPRGEASDVAQDALLAAFRSWKTYDPARGEVRAWLLAVVVNECRRSGRKASLRPVLTAEVPDVPGQPEAARDAGIEEAVALLPRRQREVVTLHYFLDVSVAETAATLGISEGTVKSTLSDARAALRRALDPSALAVAVAVAGGSRGR